MSEQVVQHIQELTGASFSELAFFLQQFSARNCSKKSQLLRAGQVANEVYFVLTGCLRLYYVKEGVDISGYFFTENMFAGAYDSFISRKPSTHSIEVLEDATLLAISYDQLQKLYVEYPRMNEFVRKIIEQRFIAIHELLTSQILDSPEERYSNLLKNHPSLLMRIPQHHLATFLGVTPVSLSRIRSRVSKRGS